MRYVERITDLPIEHSAILEKYHSEASNNASTKKKYTPEQESEKYDHFYNEYFNPERNGDEANVQKQNALNRKSKPYKNTNQFKAASTSGNYASSNQNLEYETISTSVPESLAKKIIEEAEAAGAINRTTKF